jgi:hypothetical protein
MNNEEKENTLAQIEAFLQTSIEKLEPNHAEAVGRGRPRIIPATCLWAGILVCVLRGWNSQLAIWRLLSQRGLWSYPRFPISDQAIYKRLEQAGSKPLEQLFQQVSQLLQERLEPWSQKLAEFASEVVAIDATTLDAVTRHLPLLREVEPGHRQLLPGKLAGIFDVRIQQWRHVEHIENPNENDKVIARSLLEHIQKGALILADMGYFGFAWFDNLTESGYQWISRVREKTSYTIVHTYYQKGETFDGLIWLGAYRADRSRFIVRLVTFRVGNTLHRYITNVLEPKKLSIREMALLYARRWDIEMAFKLIKRELGLHLFWSAKTPVILQQIWAVLTIAQILHGLQMEIAGRAGVDPFDVSLPLLVEYLPQWNDIDFIDLVVKQGREAGFIRPSRRIRIQTPEINLEDYLDPPPDLVLEREPRYAGRRCSSSHSRN